MTRAATSKPTKRVARIARVKIAGYDPVATSKDCHFDAKEAKRAVQFIETYASHYKGRQFIDKPFNLEKWQKDIVHTLFGWFNPDGTRRYRQAYIEIPRKNGKSTLCAALVLFMLFGDGEPGAEIYSAASDKDQATLVYNMAEAMVDKAAKLKVISRVRNSQKTIHYDRHKSFYRAIAHDSAGSHGFNAHFVVADELHAWGPKGEDFLYVLSSSVGSREQPLICTITTAGQDRHSACWREHQHACAVRDGVIDNETLLPAVYAADENDDWTKEKTWKKANPNYGVSVTARYLRQKCKEAQQKPREENRFKQLHLNLWVETAVRFIPSDRWRRCVDDKPPTFGGGACWGGLDLSTVRDLTAFALVFPTHENELFLKVWHWIPEATAREKEEIDRVPYLQWNREGWIDLTPGETIDYTYVRHKINDLREEYDIRSIAFDPYNATQFIKQLEDEDGCEVVKFTQNALNFNSPTRDFEKRIFENSIHAENNPLLFWQVTNTEVKTDTNGNIRPIKPNREETKRIDGVVASLMAIGNWMTDEGGQNPYNERGLVVL